MNKVRSNVRLSGNLGQDPEVKEFAKGKKLAKFSIGTKSWRIMGQKLPATGCNNAVMITKLPCSIYWQEILPLSQKENFG